MTSHANMTGGKQEVLPSNFDLSSQLFTSLWMGAVVLLVVTGIVQRLRMLVGSKIWHRWVVGSKAVEYNLPPMPTGGVPYFGTLFKTVGPQAHRIMWDIGKEYGALYALKTGVRYSFHVMKADVAYEALIQGGELFSSRPTLKSRLNYTGPRSVNSALYGQYWRQIRKNLVIQVLSSNRLASFKPFREMELDNLVKRLKAEAKQNDNVVNVLSPCRLTFFSILLHVCFSKTFNDSELKELDMVLRRLMVNLAPQVLDYLPFMHYFSRHKTDCQHLLARMRKLFTPLIDEHRELRKNGTPAGNYLDSIIVLQQEMNLSEADVLTLVGEVLAAGTDTTANILEWAMGNLIQHPEIQTRLYEEIKSVVPSGSSSLIGEQDVENMPYLQAIVKEALRKHPPLPFGIPRSVTQQTKLRGYDILEETSVLFHLQAFMNDPERWDHPEIFNPDRFMTETPDPDLDMTGSHGPRSLDFVPFGAGKRQCPGRNLALRNIHLILARLIQTFEWSTVNPGEDVDFSEKLAFTNMMAKPLCTRIKERSAQ